MTPSGRCGFHFPRLCPVSSGQGIAVSTLVVPLGNTFSWRSTPDICSTCVLRPPLHPYCSICSCDLPRASSRQHNFPSVSRGCASRKDRLEYSSCIWSPFSVEGLCPSDCFPDFWGRVHVSVEDRGGRNVYTCSVGKAGQILPASMQWQLPGGASDHHLP